VQLDDFTVTAPATIGAGVTRIVAKNVGEVPHEVVITRAASAEQLPRAGDGAVDLEALPRDGTFRIQAFANNTICEGTFDLPAGTYVVFDTLPAAGGAAAANHFALGMHAVVTVA